jgi:PAS domain S-box-containing protein
MNAAATRMLGWREDELRGRPMHPIVHFQHADGTPRPEEDCDLLRVRTEARAIRNNDDAFTRKDGSIIPVAYSAAPLLSGTGVRGAVIVFRDITEEHAERTRVQRELGALTWVGRIREALDEGRLVLHAQPIVPLKGGEPSVELLLRMIGRNGEIVAPGSFLPVAEKYGLIGEIDRRSVAEAIRHAAGGRRVEVNVSAESVGPGSTLLSMIERELSGGGIDPAKLVFELTETALMKDIEAGKAFALGVTRLGCGVALDDFGTGFGSFNYLKNFPIGYLKIDVDFVRDLPSNPANQHVVKAIVSLARGFGQETIAEGVEDAETLELLRAYDVDFAQGFHLGRPAALAVAAPTAASAVDSYATASASASSA